MLPLPYALALIGACSPSLQDAGTPPTTALVADSRVSTQLHERLAKLEYEVVDAGVEWPGELRSARYGAASPSQRFSTGFLPSGIRVRPWGALADDHQEAADESSWSWGLDLVAYGRDGARIPAAPPTLVAHGARVEYRRGELVEWYENSEQGLEQGFTLARRPAGDGPLRVEMSIVGTLNGVLAADARSVRFHELDAESSALHFGKLVAFDADGRFLDAHFELCGDVLAIAVDDSTAQYPLTIDPLATTPNWTTTGLSSGVKLGFSVATAGDVNGDGYSDVIVATPLRGSGLFVFGYVEVFHGSANGLSAVANWSQFGSNQGANFGHSVATAGDVNGDGYSDVIIGSYKYTNGESQEGAAFVYHGGPAGLETTPAWSAEGNQIGADFGWSVASLGDVNADGYSDVIVGAPRFDLTSPIALNNTGRAYVYLGSPAGLAASPVTTRSGTQADQRFGASVAGAGDVNGDGLSDAIVGSPLYDHTTGVDAGRFDVFNGSASGGLNLFVTTSRFGSFAGDQLGFSVAGAGDVNGDGYADVVAGAPYLSAGGFGGLAYVYHGQSTGLASSWAMSVGWTTAGAEWGHSVATAGDVNADGYADVVIGAPLANAGFGAGVSGVSYVFFGSSVGLNISEDQAFIGAASTDRFGHCVATAGDVNGDGRSDLLVGASEFDAAQPNAGRAYLYHGESSTLDNAPGWSIVGALSQQGLGAGVAAAGDVNGDGYGDVVVASRGSASVAGDGRVQVFHGSSSGLSTAANSTLTEVPLHLGLGPVSTAGDVNGDGFDDIVVGMPRLSQGETDEGGFGVIGGSSSGATNVTAFFESNVASAQVGASVSTAGDVNGDGYADIVVGAPELANGNTGEGRVYVFHGSSSGLVTSPAWTFESNVDQRWLGYSVSGGGDFNGDGYSDVLVGAPALASPSDPGSTYVFYGSPSGITTTGMQVFSGVNAPGSADGCGESVAYVGDMNGDGFADAAWTRAATLVLARGGPTGLIVEDLISSTTAVVDPVTFVGDVDGDGLSDVIYQQSGVFPQGPFRRLLRGSSSTPGSLYGSSTAWVPSSGYSKLNCAGDVNGDGYSDVIAGTSTVNGALANGEAWLYYGNARPGAPILPRQRQADDSGPIALRGWSDDPFSVRFAAIPRTPYGRVGVKLEVELESEGDTFDGAGLVASPNFVSLPASTSTISELRTTTGLRQHWRMRLRYSPANSPFQRFGRWVTMQGAGWNEGKFNRTSGAPVSYCTSGTSSGGCVPTLNASGSPSLSAGSGFTLMAAQIESQKIGRFYYGVSGRSASTWGTSDSFLCVKAPTQRMGALNSGGGLVSCDGTYVQDWLGYIAANPGALGTPFAPGQVVNVQAWYRDPASPKTTNLTGGLEFAVLP